MLSNSPCRRVVHRLAALMLLLPVGLGACAVQPAPSPPPGTDYARLVAPDTAIPLPDGTSAPARLWPAQGAPRGVVLALHGFNDSRDAWEIPAPLFTADGLAVVAPDARGFGGTATRGHWAGTAPMLADIGAEIAWVHGRFPGLPVYLMGESMGGALALLVAASEPAPPLAGVILLAPAVWSFDPGSRALMRLLATAAPAWRFTGNELPVRVHPSDNRQALLRLYFDPLSLRATRLEAIDGLLGLMHRAARPTGPMAVPVLAVYGGRDDLVPQAATRALWNHLPAGVRRDYVPGGHHLLLRDLRGATTTRDILSWIDRPEAPLPSGGDIAAAAWMAGWTDAAPAPWVPARIDALAEPSR